jgi:hypothetical protein
VKWRAKERADDGILGESALIGSGAFALVLPLCCLILLFLLGQNGREAAERTPRLLLDYLGVAVSALCPFERGNERLV